MFGVLALLIVYSLLTFGAVLPNSWFVVTIVWLTALAGCLVLVAVRRDRLPAPLIITFVLASALFAVAPPKIAIGFTAALWAWAATAMRGEKPVLRFFHFLLIVGLIEAAIGLMQFFLNPGWIFGYVNLNYRSSGTLINRNHFAGLLEMLMPVALGFAYIMVRHYREMARIYLYVLAGALMGIALLFSGSRMGIFSFLLTIFFLAFLLRMRDSRQGLAGRLAFGLAVLVMVGALWIGIDVIIARYGQVVDQDAVLRDARFQVFRDTARLITSNPWGIGAGRYQDIFRQYQTLHLDLLFDHAHNDYLETTAEWGIPMAFGFWAIVLVIFARAIRAFLDHRSPEESGILLACIGAIFSILVHSLTDFNLQIPSNAMLFFTFIGIAAAYSLPARLWRSESH